MIPWKEIQILKFKKENQMSPVVVFLINSLISELLNLLQTLGLPAIVTELQALAVKYPDFANAFNQLAADLTALEAKKSVKP